MVVGCFILLPFIMTILVPFKVIRANIIFMFLSIASVMGPVVALANYNYEFPSLLGGLIGCGLTAMLITFKVGLAPMEPFLEDIKQQQEQNRPMDASVQKMVQDLADISERIHQPGNNATTNTAANTDDNLEATETATANVNGNDNGDEEINGKHTIQVGEDGATEAVVDIDSKEEKEAESSSPPPPTLTKAASDPNRLLSAEQQLLSTSNLELQDEDGLGPRKSYSEGYLREVAMRTFPIWGVVVLLILTRIEEIGIKEHLIKQTPYFDIHFGSYGEFRLSASIVFQLRDILTYPGMNWKYELFYIPFVVPFVLVSALAMVLFKKDMTCRPQDIAATVVRRLTNPAIALTGALILVQLMIRYTTEAPAYILGNILADWLKEGFIVISPLLGALGSFFSGSTTVSNLTFGEIQRIAAESIGTNVSSMLALQVVGASAGNGICLNNIIAALAVVGLNVSEGQILIRTCRYVFALTTIATVVMLAIFFRFD